MDIVVREMKSEARVQILDEVVRAFHIVLIASGMLCIILFFFQLGASSRVG